MKQFTLRLPPDLYAKSVKVARRHKLSLNELARRGLEHITSKEAQAELQAAYDLLGSDSDSSVEAFLPAQREVVLGDD